MKKTIKILISFVLFANLGYSQKSWTRKSDFTGVARNSSMAFVLNGKAYFGLGQDASNTKLWDFYEYNPSTNAWKKLTSYPGSGSHTTCAFAINGKGYVCLGANNAGTPQKDVWEYDASNDKWTKKSDFPGTARYGATSFVINDTAFVMTGSAGGSPYLSDVWMYVAATDKWTQKSNFSGGTRLHGASFTINGVGYFGTGIKSSSTATKDVWSYNKSKDTWTQIADYPYGAITGALGFEVDGSGYLGTGYDLSKILKDIYEYIPSSNSWKKLDSIPSGQSIRGGAIAFTISKTAYITTGYYSISGSTVYSLNDLWAFNPKLKCFSFVLTQPKDRTVVLNNNAYFNVESSDSTATLKWQINTGSGFTDISSGGQFSGMDSKQLIVSNVKVSNYGNRFRCIVTGKTCSDTSVSVILKVICPPIINSHPIDLPINNGDLAKFDISSVYSQTTYQWQINKGSGYVNASNAGRYFGYDNDTFSISDVQYSDNKTKYRCILNYEGCVDSTKAATLTVICKKIIKNQPNTILVSKGSNAYLVLKTYDYGTTYQWKTRIIAVFSNITDAGQYSGSNTDSLNISNVTMTNKMQPFMCVVNYKGCSDSTNVVYLDVKCNPIVASNPSNQLKYEGENALFVVKSLDANSYYTWQRNLGTGFYNLNNSSNIDGVNNDSLIITNLKLSDNNQQYRCILFSEGCYDTSDIALLSVTCDQIISKQPISKYEYVSKNTFLNVVSNDSKATFQWQSDLGLGFQNLSNAGQYKGTDDDTLIIENLGLSNNNQKFRCIIKLGSCVATTNIVSLTIECLPLIASQPIDKTGSVSGSTYFSVSSASSGTVYQWQTNMGVGFQNLSNAGQYYGGNKDTLRVSNLSMQNNNQVFRCILTDGACKDTTEEVSLKVSVGIGKQIAINNINIHPNPSSKIIYIEVQNIENNNLLSLFNSNGQLIHEQKLEKSSTSINVDNLSPGIYFLRYISDQSVQTLKVIIE